MRALSPARRPAPAGPLLHRLSPAVAGLLVLVPSLVAPAAAQERPLSSIELRLAPGIVWAGGTFGDDDPESTRGVRPTLSGLARGHSDRWFGASFEAALEPLGARNPHFDEHLRVLYLLAGVELGGIITVRPAIGAGIQLWSGSRATSSIGLARAASIAIGHRHRRAAVRGGGVWTRVHVSPEAIARIAYSHGALSWMAGVQVPVTWRR
jgi:hypothetical protein